ncbi:MAG: hypothetical protein DRJ15_15775 [Bacteroidetes bacterium]|nr:MAG: hypothetical protein DRJ15_15775 [Bacteroidota bacterium]
MNKQEAISVCKILQSLIEIAEVSIILNTFIKAFLEKSILKPDGIYYLHGNFNLGGTVSGRLSSSKVNLQNLPSSGTKYAKLIKQCFTGVPGWIMVGADFNALEARISALTTQDPAKLKVYIDGYDSHCMNAFAYYPDQMLDIQDTCTSINSIKTKYPDLRQSSKNCTFALTYQGTWHTLVNNLGFPIDQAKQIEDNYHKLYKVSDDWVQDRIIQASIDGHVTVAFGLRVRTPILSQVILGNRQTPYEAQAEARTAGNALGQSYGQLNNRAAIEFQKRVLDSEYKYEIKPIAHIHDSQYFLIKNNLGCIKWFNDNLIECMEWQGLSEIQHPIVKLGGELEVYYPDWSCGITISNRITKRQILDICRNQ